MSKKIISILIGVLFVGIGIFMIIRGNDLAKKCTIETEATVINFNQETNVDDDTGISYTYYPIIQYEVNGQNISGQISSGSSIPAYNVNDKIDILYNPNKVDEFIVKNEKGSNIMAIIIIVAGALVIVGSIVAIVKKD